MYPSIILKLFFSNPDADVDMGNDDDDDDDDDDPIATAVPAMPQPPPPIATAVPVMPQPPPFEFTTQSGNAIIPKERILRGTVLP